MLKAENKQDYVGGIPIFLKICGLQKYSHMNKWSFENRNSFVLMKTFMRVEEKIATI